ncbi:hypothetical protein C8R43DRAFT_1134518 [Mycena crocata]|nr:hypothetical protein C8R43DRAFT_1134518 [Mycena crocata]
MASRPRPRPVPRAKTTQPSSSTTTGPSPVLPAVVDDDAMFMRNQRRTATTWKQLEKINKAPKNKNKTARSDSEGDSDSPRPRKQKKKTGDTAQAKINRLLSEGLSSDSDSDVLEITDPSGTPGRNKRGKKRRSRSRSITPPPALSRQQLQIARDTVRKALNVGDSPPRAPSPGFDADESTDTIIFDPELQKIASSAAAQARAYSEPTTDAESQETLEITINWQPHPLNEAGKKTTTVFKLNRTDNFRDLFEAVAEDESILSESLIMSYNGARLFPSVTPAALNMWENAELIASDKTTWEYMRAHPNGASADADDAPLELSDTDGDAGSPAASNTQESDGADSDAGGETMKLTLRSALTTKDIVLTVRPTTTCGAIVQAFLKKAGLADKYGSGSGNGKGPRKSVGGKGKGKKGAAAPEPAKMPQLAVDGDKVGNDVQIGDADVDDGDMVDVVGL